MRPCSRLDGLGGCRLVDPGWAGQPGRRRRLAHEALGVGGVGAGQDHGPRLADPGSTAVVDVGGRVVADAGVTVLVVVPAKAAFAEGPRVLQRSEPFRELGPVLERLELGLRVGLSFEQWGREWLLVTPRSASSNATGLELIEEPRSAWMVSWSGSTPCLRMLSASSRSASSAASLVASVQPTT
jgi:hypothetical protein